MILFRYLFTTALLRILLAAVALAVVALAFDLGDQGRRLAASLGWSTVLRASLLHLPLVVVQVLPAALLLGGVLALARLRHGGELAALALAGAGPWRVRAPLLATGVLCAASALALDELLVPPCEQAADQLYQHRRASPLTGLGAASSWVKLDRWVLHRRQVQGQTRLLALELDPQFAVVRRVEGTPTSLQARQFAPHLAVPADLGQLQRRAHKLWNRGFVRAEAQSFAELRRYLRRRQAAGQQRPVETLVLHTKLAYPLINLSAAMLACLFAAPWRRRAGVLDLLAAVGLVLGLWVLLAGGWLVARGGWLSPALAVWLPVLLGLAGAALLLRLQTWARPMGRGTTRRR